MATVDRGPVQASMPVYRLWLFCTAFLACIAGVYAQSDTLLTSGVDYNGGSSLGLVGAGGTQTFFRIVVPAGQVKLIVQTSGGDGDVDLYVRRGARPTASTYDAASAGPTTVESVTINNPVADTYYIMLQGYGAGYLGVTLNATFQVVPPPTWTWAKSTAGGDYLNVRDTCGAARDSLGNVYFTGYFGDTINFGANRLISGSGFLPVQSGFLAKYDANGQAVWALMNVGTQGWAVTVGPDDSV
jgi:hypothetical protein